jgi:hypothetical protein
MSVTPKQALADQPRRKQHFFWIAWLLGAVMLTVAQGESASPGDATRRPQARAAGDSGRPEAAWKFIVSPS